KTQKGHFDVQGQIPETSDKRMSFVKGWFQDTLPKFLNERKISSRLVIHNDSDLYSSTLYVLTRCNDVIVVGTVIIFDEFSSITHEFRALLDYCSSYGRKYKVIGATYSSESYFGQVAIEII